MKGILHTTTAVMISLSFAVSSAESNACGYQQVDGQQVEMHLVNLQGTNEYGRCEQIQPFSSYTTIDSSGNGVKISTNIENTTEFRMRCELYASYDTKTLVIDIDGIAWEKIGSAGGSTPEMVVFRVTHKTGNIIFEEVRNAANADGTIVPGLLKVNTVNNIGGAELFIKLTDPWSDNRVALIVSKICVGHLK